MPTFASLGVPADLVDALDARGITDAFPVQAATIPDALAGRDVSGKAPTGSGKTFAFGIPLVANVDRARPKRPRALVLVPTRELAAQVARDLEELGAQRGCRVHAFYGGVGFEGQLKALRRGVDIAVACPGRLADLVNRGDCRLDGVDRVVVDEADRMADMGFLPEVKRLLDQTSADRQTLLFSATLDGDVDVLVKRYQRNPVVHDATPPDADPGRIRHHHWLVDKSSRVEVCASVIDRLGQTIVFTRTKHGADRVAKQLVRAGVDAVAIHGDRSQAQRDRALAAFAGGRSVALVATDVAARGIHVDNVACVIHHDLPPDEKDYVHRSGRTGRAGEEGLVVALVMADQRKDAQKLARKLGLDVELLTTGPHLEALGPRQARTRTRAAGPRPTADKPAVQGSATDDRPHTRRKAPTINSLAGPARKQRPGRREREAARERGGEAAPPAIDRPSTDSSRRRTGPQGEVDSRARRAPATTSRREAAAQRSPAARNAERAEGRDRDRDRGRAGAPTGRPAGSKSGGYRGRAGSGSTPSGGGAVKRSGAPGGRRGNAR